ncbi:MAG: hypothetical protein FJ222_01570 [Lentisphaerae bacterium]|nr:hypothetical protein [Lentisphaerota bacterium]
MRIHRSQTRLFRMGVVSTLACGLGAAGCAMADAGERMPAQEATIQKAAGAMVVDGKLDEQAWQTAAKLPIAVLHNKNGKTLETPIGYARLTWDDANVYVAFDVTDDDIRAVGAGRDDVNLDAPNDLVEVFLDVHNDDHHFFEFHVNPLNGFTDLFILRPAKDTPLYQRLPPYKILFMKEYNLPAYETAVQIQGTLNDSEQKDAGWTAEIRLPYTSLMLPNGQKKPKVGDLWRVQLVIQNGGADNRYVNWSPTYDNWYHHSIATWGRIRFSE